MELKDFNFPKVGGLDMAFSTYRTDPILLQEARDRGFYNGHTKYNELFSTLFFNGGKLDFKQGLDKDFKAMAVPYLKSFMGSFEPSHGEKEAICALLLSELVEA